MRAVDLASYIRDIPDFPQKGIVFKDITPLLRDRGAFAAAVQGLGERFAGTPVDVVVAVEARGYILGAPLAYSLGVGFVPIRKVGKLPWETYRAEYLLEYGASVIEMHRDGLQLGQRALIVDDVLATGGTLEATARLVEQSGARVVGMGVLLELAALKGRERLKGYRLEALLRV
jgi:adenine phosphoribosyltransferase